MRDNENYRIAAFDVCGTLYKSNTTFDFLDQYFKSNVEYLNFRKITKRTSLVIINHIINKIFYTDLIRVRAIKFLKGVPIDEIKKATKLFLEEELSTKRIQDVFDIMQYYRNNGYKIILMSASLDFIIEAIHETLDANAYFATKLEIINGKYTGKILFDQTHDKAQVLTTNYNDIDDLVVLSDNLSDYKLLKMADKKKIICWKQKHYEYWKNKDMQNVEYLKMYK